MTKEVFETSVRQTLAISCMFMWIILAALGFGAVFDGLGGVVWTLTQNTAGAIGAVFVTFSAMFQHMNKRTPHWVGYFIQRPESHSLHHGRGVHAYNYADLPLVDMLFGTFANPEEHRADAEKWRETMIEKVAEAAHEAGDDTLFEKYVAGEKPTNAEVKQAIRAATKLPIGVGFGIRDA